MRMNASKRINSKINKFRNDKKYKRSNVENKGNFERIKIGNYKIKVNGSGDSNKENLYILNDKIYKIRASIFNVLGDENISKLTTKGQIEFKIIMRDIKGALASNNISNKLSLLDRYDKVLRKEGI